MDRRTALIGLLAGACAPTQILHGDQPVESHFEFGGRLSIPVMINGAGPYRFVIDSAANASLVADDLASGLGLPVTEEIHVHTLIAREKMVAVRPDHMQAGVLSVKSPRLAVASRTGLHGVDGLLGSDLLRDLKLVMNFRGRGRATIRRSGKEHTSFLDAPRPTTRLLNRAEKVTGGPVAIGVHVNGAPGRAIIDTGAETTIINSAMAGLGARPIRLSDGSPNQDVSSPTGRSATAAVMTLPNLEFAGVSLEQVPVLAGDFHVFNFWGLADQPTMLMGVDVLGLFRTVSIDLRRAEVVLEL